MAKKSSETPPGGPENDAVQDQAEDASARLLAKLEGLPSSGEAILERVREQLMAQCEALSGLAAELEQARDGMTDELAGVQEEARSARDAWREAKAREQALLAEKESLGTRLDKTELELVVAREQAAAHEETIEALRAEVKQAAEAKAQAERRADDAEKAAAKAKATEQKVAKQLDEALESMTEAGLEKAELERRIRDLEEGFEAVKEERAGAEERWNATDDQRLARIKELEGRAGTLQTDLDKARQELESARTAGNQEKETLEQAWKEATELREALAAARKEANERIEVLERQQEEFIAKLVDEYDEQLAAARAEIEKLHEKEIDEASLHQARAERDEALAELETVRQQAKAAATLQAELDELREKPPSGDEASLREELDRVRADLDAARAGVDQLLLDCDALQAENIRLKQAMKEHDVRPSSAPFEPQDTAGSDAMALAESRAAAAPVEERPAGSYSLIADDSTKRRRKE